MNSQVRSQPSTPFEVMRELSQLMSEFCERGDVSMKKAGEIEGLIATALDDDHPLQELADDFAQYTPQGGDYLYAAKDMVPIVQHWLARIKAGEFPNASAEER